MLAECSGAIKQLTDLLRALYVDMLRDEEDGFGLS